MQKIDLFLLLKNRRANRLVKSTRHQQFLQKIAVGLVASLSFTLVTALFIAGLWYARIARDLPTIAELPILLDQKNGELLQPTRILDRSGMVTLYTYRNSDNPYTYLKVDPDLPNHISPQLIRAAITLLEPDFWSSPGYSPKSLSDPNPHTIAEILVDDLLLWQEANSPERALRMRLLAAQVVKEYGRTQVLEWYLNSAWFGQHAFGVESASQLYLGISASDLNLAEAALLAPLLQSPGLDPISTPDAAVEMQRTLLDEMAAGGVIQQEEFDQAVSQPLTLADLPPQNASARPGFVSLIEDQLTNTFGHQRLQRGGLEVISTLDADLQNQLHCATITQLTRIQSSNITGVASGEGDCPASLLLPTQSFSTQTLETLAAASLVMNPRTGELLAYQEPLLITGETLADGGYQPGSMLTPFATLAAFARGYSPASLMWDIPGKFSENAGDHTYQGPVSLRESLANDYLDPLATLLEGIGAANIWRSTTAFGFRSLSAQGNSVQPLFSGADTNLVEMGGAYATLANSGVRVGELEMPSREITPSTVSMVRTATGRLILELNEPDKAVILSESLAYLINHVLSDENARWSSMGHPNVLETGTPIASKTGRTRDGRQVWTVGYQPERLVLVWMGDKSGVEGNGSLDIRMPAGLWNAIFRYSTQNLTFNGWDQPADVILLKVCTPSGMLPNKDCPEVVNEIFLMDNEPVIPDSLYLRIKVNRETGQRATVFTPPDLIEERVFLQVPPEALAWAQSSGIPLPPRGYDSIQQSNPNPQVNITSPVMFSQVRGKVVIIGNANTEGLGFYSLQIGEGINPVSWFQVGDSSNQRVVDSTLASWDAQALNGLYAIRLTVVNKDNSLQTAVTQVTVDNIAPTARITYPQNGEVVSARKEGIALIAVVEDFSGIGRVEWWLDGKQVSTQTSAPFVHLLLSSPGKHEIQIKAWDLAGNEVRSDKVEFSVK